MYIRCQSPKYENGFLTFMALGVGSGNEYYLMKIYDFFYSAKSFSHPVYIILCKNHREDDDSFTQYYTG